jgi:hypothetical protein
MPDELTNSAIALPLLPQQCLVIGDDDLNPDWAWMVRVSGKSGTAGGDKQEYAEVLLKQE